MPLVSRLHANVRVASREPPSHTRLHLAASVVARPRPSPLIAAHIGGWLLLVILVPLLVNLWGQQPFELPKVMILRTLVWLLAGGLLARSLFAARPQFLPSYAFGGPLAGPLLLLSLVVVVTTFTAADWRLSMWGSYSRGQGAITLLTYLLLCWLAATQLRGTARAQQIMTALVATAMPIALFTLAQSGGWNPFGLLTDARSEGYATLGRANFVAAYLAMLAPLTLAVALTPVTRARATHARRMGWFILLGIELLAIALTWARSAWLAAAVALGLFALLWWGRHLARPWRLLAGGSLGLLAVSGPLAVLGLGPQRIDSLAARLHIWQGSWTLITERPLLGYGADGLGLVFWRVYPPQLVYTQGRNVVVDRAHNLLLDWLMIAGVPGLCAYLLVLATFVVIVWRALRQPVSLRQRALLIGILTAVAANIVNNLTSFDVTPTAMATWLLMGLGVTVATRHRVPKPPQRIPIAIRGHWRWVVVALLWLGIGGAIWQINVRPLWADIATRTAQRAAQAENWPRVHVAAAQAVAHWPLEPAHHILLSQSAWRLAQTQPDSTRWLAASEAALLEARRLRPHDPLVWQHLAQFYAAAAYQFDHNTDALAATAFQQAITLAPTHAPLCVAGGKAAFAAGDVARAATLLRQAVVLDSSNGDAYLALGAAEAALGRWEIALADYREAVRLLPHSPEAAAALAQAIQAAQAE